MFYFNEKYTAPQNTTGFNHNHWSKVKKILAILYYPSYTTSYVNPKLVNPAFKSCWHQVSKIILKKISPTFFFIVFYMNIYYFLVKRILMAFHQKEDIDCLTIVVFVFCFFFALCLTIVDKSLNNIFNNK